MDIKIIKKEPLTLVKINKILSGLGKKSELPPIQQKVINFTKKFSKISESNAEKLFEELKNLGVPMLTDEHIVQIINIMPKDLAELKSVFAGSKTTVSPENFKKILDVVLKYNKK